MSVMKNMLIADLRSVNSVEAARNIEEVKNVVTLILPENGDPEVLDAIAAIPKINIANTIYLPIGAPTRSINGSARLSAPMLQQEGLLVISGSCVVTEVCNDCKAILSIAGSLKHPKSCAVKIVNVAGSCKALDYEHYISFDDDFELDAATLDLLDYKTLLDIDGDLYVSKNVSLEQLKEKMPYFIVDGDVRCTQELAAYMKLRAEIDGRLRIKAPHFLEDDE